MSGDMKHPRDAVPEGHRVNFAADNELLIDIDNAADLAVFQAHVEILRAVYPCLTFEICPSRKRPDGRHVHVRLWDWNTTHKALKPEERLLLQALLGSDRKRELLGLLQLRVAKFTETSTALQVLPPRAKHVNIHPFCLHLWCCLDGDVTPDFTQGSGSL